MVNNLTKEINHVYQTKNYTFFKFITNNRRINEGHVKSLKNHMRLHGWLRGSYVIVNGKGEIIDGQHRVKAAMELGIPINYIIDTKITIDDIGSLNSRNKNWQLVDFIDQYVRKDFEHYIKLNNFMKMYPELKPTECMMLCGGAFTNPTREDFEDGKFVTKNMDKAVEWAMGIISLKPYFERYNGSTFVRALVKIMTKKNKFVLTEFVDKVRKRPTRMFICGSVTEYIKVIEDVYNFGRIKENRINLRDIV